MSRPQLEALLQQFDRSAVSANPFSADEARRTWYAFTENFEVPADIELLVAAGTGRGLEWATRPGLRADKAVLYLHGGGYLCGSARSHRVVTCGIARWFDGTVANLDYRLAPENPFPAALDDAITAFDTLLARGLPARSIAVAGDSAGGGLVLSLMLELRRRSRELPGAGWCISPWFDLSSRIDRVASNVVRDPIVFAEVLDESARLYLGGFPATDDVVSPITAGLGGLPPLLIQAGSTELLLDDSLRLERVASAAGVKVTLEVWPDMVHAWHLFARQLSEGEEAIRRGAMWLNGMLES